MATGPRGSSLLGSLLLPLPVAGTVAALLLAGWLDRPELLTVDLRYRFSPSLPPAPLALVAIDNESMKETGAWPWPRTSYAKVLRAAAAGGARGALIDLDLSSPAPDPAGDRDLAAALSALPTALAVHMQEKTGEGGVLVRSLSLPTPVLGRAAGAVGGIVFAPDADGTVRRAPPFIDFGEESFPPLGLVGARMLAGPGVADPPADSFIHFSPALPERLPAVSFNRVLAGDIPPGFFRDRLVLVGATTFELRDFWSTPAGIIPGVYIHAAVIESALAGAWYRPLSPAARALLLVAACLGLGLALGRSGWRAGGVALLAYLSLVLAIGFLALRLGVMAPLSPLLLAGALLYPLNTLLLARRSEKGLKLAHQRAEAMLRMAELKSAEGSGTEPYAVPLLLLHQLMGLSAVSLCRPDGAGGWRVERVLGDAVPEEPLLAESLSSGEVLRRSGGGEALYLPIRTVRGALGVLFAAGGKGFRAGDEEARLLLAFATQTAYFLESRELDERVKSLYLNTIRAISTALDSRDHYTGAHAEHSVELVERFGAACGLGGGQMESLRLGALLHDIGKIGVPDAVLLKQGRLEEGEYARMKSHPVVGFSIIGGLPFPEDVKLIVRHHHERFDGRGYPDGLKGEGIPYLVRVFSIVDVYEALRARRPYKEPMSEAEVREEMRRSSGQHFDPALVEVFLSVVTEERSAP